MFEFFYAKKVKSNELVDVIKENVDKYRIHITFKRNGTVEVFIGTEREQKVKENEYEID